MQARTPWSKTVCLSPRVTDLQINRFCSFANVSNLDLSGCYLISNKALFIISRSLYYLKQLSLRACPEITNEGIEYLTKLLRLRSIDVSSCNEIDSRGLSQLTNIEELYAASILDDEDLKTIGQKYKELHILHIPDSGGITSKGLDNLRNLPLQELNVANCKMISNLHSLPKTITNLDLSESNIADANLWSVGELPLKQLNLYGCMNITSNSLEYLHSAPLESLDLGRCIMTTTKPLPRTLRKLSLNSCFLRPDVLADLPPKLEELDLSDTNIIQDRDLAHLETQTNLIKLELSGCNFITEKGLKYIIEQLPLQVLDVSDCALIPENYSFFK
jgi:hypothetical protein